MFPNLEAEMARSRLKKCELSKFLGVRYATVHDKMNGRSKFTLDEAVKIQKKFFPALSLEYLFWQQAQVTA
ncbi:hypothetical protein [Paenibacillus sp. y28]|uniref:hypothetical protein n=1 Tax=Paenibacillus sp. y28 TaxID=3129110 RepID=UPI003019B562